jgi:hypothetical protein
VGELVGVRVHAVEGTPLTSVEGTPYAMGMTQKDTMQDTVTVMAPPAAAKAVRNLAVTGPSGPACYTSSTGWVYAAIPADRLPEAARHGATQIF